MLAAVRSDTTPLSALPRRLARGLARYKGKSLMPRANARHGPLAKQLNECARDGNVAGALTLFDGSDATLSTRSYNSLLTLLVDGHRDDFRRVRDHMRAAGVAADESTLSLELRGLVADGALDDAFASLRAAAAEGVALKLRSYTALHRALCERRELARVDDLHAHMRAHGVEPAEAELVDAAALGAAVGEGDGALDARLRTLQAARAQLQPTSLRALLRAWGGAAAEDVASSGAAASGATASGRRARLATVGADGTCSACGARLEKLPLTAAQRQTLAAALLAAADERGQRGELERFGAWVAGAAAPFAYIVDGANVGYRSQNFEGGRFSFAQVEIARLALRERAGGREPLLVLPARYVGADGAVPNHTALATGVGIGSRKRRAEANRMEPLSADDAACVARWRAAGALWEVPDAANDDWHWMYATLLGGADARVLTNDEMRDHALRCAETEGAGGGGGNVVPSAFFARWRARHLVRFDFSHGAKEDRPPPALTLREPPQYSEEGQRSARGWHFPSAREPDGGGAREWLWLEVAADEEEVEGEGEPMRPRQT